MDGRTLAFLELLVGAKNVSVLYILEISNTAFDNLLALSQTNLDGPAQVDDNTQCFLCHPPPGQCDDYQGIVPSVCAGHLSQSHIPKTVTQFN